MDKDEMLKAFKQHIRNKSTDKLIEDLQECGLDVTTDYLLGFSNIKNPNVESNLTHEYYSIATELQNESISIDDIRCFIEIIKRNRQSP